MRRLIIIALCLVTIACAPTPGEPGIYLNDNPEMALDGCIYNQFINDAGDVEVLTQCTPSGYELDEHVINYPMRAEYTGAGYTIRPNGAFGGLGYTQTTSLDAGCYFAKASGFIHFWGVGDGWIQFDLDGKELGKHPIIANGNYLAGVPFEITTSGNYELAVYLWLQHASSTADSYIQFSTITIEAVDIGNCAVLN